MNLEKKYLTRVQYLFIYKSNLLYNPLSYTMDYFEQNGNSISEQ